MSWRFKFTIAFVFILFAGRVSAQLVSAGDLARFTTSADTFWQSHSVEKPYLQFDKPYYAQGDTIWFKAYLFDAAYLNPSTKSGILYVELTTDSNKLIKRMMLPVAHGMSWGNITIDPQEMPEGGYVLSAYTNWMRNFGEAYVFKKGFYFGGSAENSWLVNTSIKLSGHASDTARLQLQFTNVNHQPLILQDMNLKILDGKKLWYKSNTQTKLDGSVDLSFALKSPAKHINLLINGTAAGDSPQELKIPITLMRTEDMDLQFMPEGGNLVAGLPATVGFKAIGPDGKSVPNEGNIYDSRDQLIASFKSVHSGIGTFEMIPKAGETYTAKVTLSNSAVKIFSLPAVKIEGTALK